MTELYVTEALDRVPADEAGPGEIVALAGLPDVTIGETIADPDDPRPLPVTTVDEPSLSVTIGINTSVLAGTEGDKLTATQIKGRLDQELVGNVSLRVLPTSQPDAWEVQGRGELQLAVLVELMRREGFELTVGKPEVLTREIDGKRCEPIERVAIDVPEEYVGVVTQLLALRKGRLQQMVNHGTGWARMEYLVPTRGLIGFRTEFLTETRGTGILHHVFEGWEPWRGELRTRPSGSLVADRRGQATGYAIQALQERGSLFVKPGDELYEGMVVGENARARGPRRERVEAEEADEHARVLRRRADPADPARGSSRSSRRSSSSATTRRSRSRRSRSGCGRSSSRRRSGRAWRRAASASGSPLRARRRLAPPTSATAADPASDDVELEKPEEDGNRELHQSPDGRADRETQCDEQRDDHAPAPGCHRPARIAAIPATATSAQPRANHSSQVNSRRSSATRPLTAAT